MYNIEFIEFIENIAALQLD